MNVEYHKWWSPSLGRDMELKVYGHYGKPVIVFPAQQGRFYDFEGFGMVEACSWLIEQGKVKLFTVDSVDGESWCNWGAHPADRGRRHEDYDRYVMTEVAPFVKQHCGNTEQLLLTTGCSLGGYHAANFFFRHPGVFDAAISLSGLFQLRHYVGDYVDDNVYFNSPLYYLANLSDPWYLDRYRRSMIVICAGQGAWEEEMLADAREIKRILDAKGVLAWVDLWGGDVNHDWPWWRRQLPYFLARLPTDNPST